MWRTSVSSRSPDSTASSRASSAAPPSGHIAATRSNTAANPDCANRAASSRNWPLDGRDDPLTVGRELGGGPAEQRGERGDADAVRPVRLFEGVEQPQPVRGAGREEDARPAREHGRHADLFEFRAHHRDLIVGAYEHRDVAGFHRPRFASAPSHGSAPVRSADRRCRGRRPRRSAARTVRDGGQPRSAQRPGPTRGR